MGLETKSFQQSMTNMVDWVLNHTNRLVDFTPGSIIRSIFEAVATEVEELYFKMQKNFLWSVENSVYQSFSFQRREGVAAYGTVRITFSSPLSTPLSIPIGTRFATRTGNAPLYFETKQLYVVPQDAIQANITVHCTEIGTIGNVNADTITTMINPIALVASVTNSSRFLTGKEEETAAERKHRFSQYVQTRSRGTKKALAYGAIEVPAITGVYVDDSQIGHVTVYAHDAAGDLPQSVLDDVKTNLENYRSAGIPVTILPVQKTKQDITATLTVDSSYNNETFRQYVKEQVENYLDKRSLGEDLFLSSLNAYIRELSPLGIMNCQFSLPVSDVITQKYQLIRSGTVTINLITEG